MAVAGLLGRPVVTLEDAFLRSLRPGRTGEAPVGLILDDIGVHHDAARPSRLEALLETGDLSGGAGPLALWRELALSKVNHWHVTEDLPEPGFVLVADQTRGDAAIAGAGAGPATFRAMLAAARAEHPGRRILIRTHPEVAEGRAEGHFGPGDLAPGIAFETRAIAPALLLARAAAVYAVSSQLGFEAILHGHRPRVFGAAFYSGWGLCEGEPALPRRTRRLTAEALFAGAMLRLPLWYDPFADALTDFGTVARQMAERARAWAANARPAFCLGMRVWKRPVVRAFLDGPGGPPRFCDGTDEAVAAAAAAGGRVVVWAGREAPELGPRAAAAGVPVLRMEDGFLRSVGLGAGLVAPASLLLDDLGIHYDPSRPSRLEALVAEAAGLAPEALARAAALRAALVAAGVSKYNAGRGTGLGPLPAGRPVVLVPGQVEDDAGLLRAAGAVRTNAGLLAAARAARPGAFLVYKPHPDVEAGLRPGRIAAREADAVAAGADPAALLALADEVWTISSLLGFEALLRGVPVTCLGAPFYAGWGLTADLGPVPARRVARPSVDALVWAALIALPLYRDPATGLACGPEVVLARLAARHPAASRAPDAARRLLARLQARFAFASALWRR